nr:putative PEP-binding protein [Kitasatospora indigofera]
MAEIPADILLAEQFAERFDGFSIDSNDLTRLTPGVDRDSDLPAHLFDERNPAVTRSIEALVATAHAAGRTVGLCGQRPGNDPEAARSGRRGRCRVTSPGTALRPLQVSGPPLGRRTGSRCLSAGHLPARYARGCSTRRSVSSSAQSRV